MIVAKKAYTTNELVELLKLTRQAVNYRSSSKCENWQSRPREGRGGGYEWLVDSMPEATRQALALAVANNIRIAKAAELPSLMPEAFTVNTMTELSENKQERSAARAFVVNLAHNFHLVSDKSRTVDYTVFCDAYNCSRVDVPVWVRLHVPTVCRKTLLNWEKTIEQQGLSGVMGKHGRHRIGKGLIDATEGMADVIISHIIKYYYVTALDVMDALKVTHAGQPLPSERSLQRWMKQYRKANPRSILKEHNPDGYRSKNQVAFGSRSANIFRLNQLWELDSSPTDVLLADGKRYAVIGGIDVFTRRTCLKIAKTSNAQGVCSLLRRMFLTFGVPERVKMDNGAEYKNERVVGVLSDMQIAFEYCTPYTPEEKPHIERFFGTFQRHLKKQPGFIGHSVAHRKAIESRRSFAERLTKKLGNTESKTLWELPYTPEEFQAFCDHYCNNAYGERKHSSLGASPNEIASIASLKTPPRFVMNERALDILLMPAAQNNGIRKVRKEGILLEKRFYIAPALGGIIGDDVFVRLDEDNAGYIHVFDLDNRFICRAEDPEFLGVSRKDIATAARRVQKAVENQKAKEAKKLVAKIKPQELIPHIIEAQKQVAIENQADRELRFGAIPSKEYSTPALEEALHAVTSQKAYTPASMTAEEALERKKFEESWNTPAQASQDKPLQHDLASKEAFVTYVNLVGRKNAGETLTPAEVKWYLGYQSTVYLQTYQGMLNDFGADAFTGIEAFAL